MFILYFNLQIHQPELYRIHRLGRRGDNERTKTQGRDLRAEQRYLLSSIICVFSTYTWYLVFSIQYIQYSVRSIQYSVFSTFRLSVLCAAHSRQSALMSPFEILLDPLNSNRQQNFETLPSPMYELRVQPMIQHTPCKSTTQFGPKFRAHLPFYRA